MAGLDFLQPVVKLFSFAMMQDMPKFLDQLVNGPGRFAGLTDGGQGCLPRLIQISRIANKEPDGLLRRKSLDRGFEEPQRFERAAIALAVGGETDGPCVQFPCIPSL